MSDNRIQTDPSATASGAHHSHETQQTREADITLPSTDVMVVIFAWEKLRVIYNIVLLCVGAWYFNPIGVIFVALISLPCVALANLCFCAGPVVECYLCLLLLPRRGVRWLVFAIGLVVAVSLLAGECARFQAVWADK